MTGTGVSGLPAMERVTDEGHGALIADRFFESLRVASVELVAGLPESLMRTVFRRLLDGVPGIPYVPVSNEAELPGIAAGAYLGGVRSLVLMENSGIRQCCEAVARLSFSHQIPFVLGMTYRGELGETNWWGHSHAQTMIPVLQALRIPFTHVRTPDDMVGAVDLAWKHADSSQWPVALIYGGQAVEH